VGGRPQRWPWGELKNLIRKQFELTRSWPHSNEEIKAIFRSMLLALGYSEEQDAALKMPGETQLKKYASELMSEINNRSLR